MIWSYVKDVRRREFADLSQERFWTVGKCSRNTAFRYHHRLNIYVHFYFKRLFVNLKSLALIKLSFIPFTSHIIVFFVFFIYFILPVQPFQRPQRNISYVLVSRVIRNIRQVEVFTFQLHDQLKPRHFWTATVSFSRCSEEQRSCIVALNMLNWFIYCLQHEAAQQFRVCSVFPKGSVCPEPPAIFKPHQTEPPPPAQGCFLLSCNANDIRLTNELQFIITLSSRDVLAKKYGLISHLH